MNQRKTILRLVTSVRLVLESKCCIFITELDTISDLAQECFSFWHRKQVFFPIPPSFTIFERKNYFIDPINDFEITVKLKQCAKV